MDFNKNIFIQQGIIDCQIDQLIKYSNTDSQIKKFTSDPTRFKNHQSFKDWLNKGRLIYTLVDKNNNLFGITWFGKKTPPIKLDADFTFALRLYGSARGQGLSTKFVKTVLQDLIKNKKEIIKLWLEVSTDNLPALHTYKKIGFKKIKKLNNKFIMILNLD
jgi:RimJ/RimL family protein N-acetyltransferase